MTATSWSALGVRGGPLLAAASPPTYTAGFDTDCRNSFTVTPRFSRLTPPASRSRSSISGTRPALWTAMSVSKPSSRPRCAARTTRRSPSVSRPLTSVSTSTRIPTSRVRRTSRATRSGSKAEIEVLHERPVLEAADAAENVDAHENSLIPVIIASQRVRPSAITSLRTGMMIVTRRPIRESRAHRPRSAYEAPPRDPCATGPRAAPADGIAVARAVGAAAAARARGARRTTHRASAYSRGRTISRPAGQSLGGTGRSTGGPFHHASGRPRQVQSPTADRCCPEPTTRAVLDRQGRQRPLVARARPRTRGD